MICTQCGFQNPEGSRFCRQCGAPLSSENNEPINPPQPIFPPQQPGYQQPQQTPYAPAQQPYQPPYGTPPYTGVAKKKKTGLIIGLIAGGVVLIAAAVLLYLFVFSGTPVVGQWYCEERAMVLDFSDNGTIDGYSLKGSDDFDYEYNKTKATGTITGDDVDLSFAVKKSKLIVTGEESEKLTFVKLKQDSDIEAVVLSALQGLWSSEEIGEVLKFDDGTVYVYSGYGDFEGAYQYDIDKGNGAFSVNEKDYVFYADYDHLSATDTGEYEKAEDDLDIEAFVSEHAMPIVGMWYDTLGIYGTIEFYLDGTAQYMMFEQPFSATYTFDFATGTGTFYSDYSGESLPLTYTDGIIEIDGISYSKDFVEQMGADDLQASISGLWYETTGTQGTVSFYDDGSVGFDYNGQFASGTYTYNAIDGSGLITMDDGITTLDFYYDEDFLYFYETTYTRDYVEPVTDIIGTWYDLAGLSGILIFYDDASVYMETYGIILTGTYSFDTASGTGTITVSYLDETINGALSLSNGILDFEGIQYTSEYVEQAVYTGP